MQIHKKQAYQTVGLRAVSLGGAKVIPFAPRGRLSARFDARAPSTFADSVYLQHIIAYLKEARKERGTSLAKVTKKARLKRGVIERAEMNGTVPTTREFKAWAAALNLVWDEVWSAALPKVTEFPQTAERVVTAVASARAGRSR